MRSSQGFIRLGKKISNYAFSNLEINGSFSVSHSETKGRTKCDNIRNRTNLQWPSQNLIKEYVRYFLVFFESNSFSSFVPLANKLDLRVPEAQDEDSEEDDEDKQSVSTQAGKRLAKRLGAVEYFECSALNKEGIFDMFAKAATHVYKGKPIKCTIL